MTAGWRVGGAVAALMVLTACGSGGEAQGRESSAPGAGTGSATIDAATTGAGPADAVVSAGLDLSTIPVSSAALGAFPYFSLPTGYVRTGEEAHDFFAFPFWVHGAFRPVEGKVHMSMVEASDRRQRLPDPA